MKCADCELRVNPNGLGTYREVNGWEKVRGAGGANAIVLRHETGRLLCGGCGERRKLNARHGVISGQQSLV